MRGSTKYKKAFEPWQIEPGLIIDAVAAGFELGRSI